MHRLSMPRRIWVSFERHCGNNAQGQHWPLEWEAQLILVDAQVIVLPLHFPVKHGKNELAGASALSRVYVGVTELQEFCPNLNSKAFAAQ